MLGLLADVSEDAFAADRGARERIFSIGAIRVFNTLVPDADAEDVRAAFSWAIRRKAVTMKAIRAPEGTDAA